jgi:mono/diheme cytochrome c family protein
MLDYLLKISVGIFFISLISVNTFAKEVSYEIKKAPPEYQALKNPFTSQNDLKKGKEMYQEKCSDCHGANGEGDDEGAVVFKNKKYMSTRSDGQLLYISKEGNGEDATMEAWGPESDYGLSEEKLWQMIFYIRSLAK